MTDSEFIERLARITRYYFSGILTKHSAAVEFKKLLKEDNRDIEWVKKNLKDRVKNELTANYGKREIK